MRYTKAYLYKQHHGFHYKRVTFQNLNNMQYMLNVCKYTKLLSEPEA